MSISAALSAALLGVGLVGAFIVGMGVLHYFFPGIGQNRGDDYFKLQRMDKKLDLLLKQAGIEFDPYYPYKDLSGDVADALRRGQKIEAIKYYREATGCSLLEAKNFVEAAQRRTAKS